MVPTLKIDAQALRDNCFINAYQTDINNDIDYNEAIFLLFKPSDLNVFREFLNDEYERTKQIIEDYDYEGGYVVVVYTLDVTYKKDFNLIKQGKYSETSKNFQDLFPKFVTIKNKKVQSKSLQDMIFKKDQKLINFWQDIISTEYLTHFHLEVWPNFDKNKETLNIKEIIENEQNKESVTRTPNNNR